MNDEMMMDSLSMTDLCYHIIIITLFLLLSYVLLLSFLLFVCIFFVFHISYSVQCKVFSMFVKKEQLGLSIHFSHIEYFILSIREGMIEIPLAPQFYRFISIEEEYFSSFHLFSSVSSHQSYIIRLLFLN